MKTFNCYTKINNSIVIRTVIADSATKALALLFKETKNMKWDIVEKLDYNWQNAIKRSN